MNTFRTLKITTFFALCAASEQSNVMQAKFGKKDVFAVSEKAAA
jgi:hypothetical protein